MLDDLKLLFKDGLQYTHTAGVLQQLANLTQIVHVQYMVDGSARNTAIDVICKILQSHKEVAAAAPEKTTIEPKKED
jgi:hypothetical protein